MAQPEAAPLTAKEMREALDLARRGHEANESLLAQVRELQAAKDTPQAADPDLIAVLKEVEQETGQIPAELTEGFGKKMGAVETRLGLLAGAAVVIACAQTVQAVLAIIEHINR